MKTKLAILAPLAVGWLALLPGCSEQNSSAQHDLIQAANSAVNGDVAASHTWCDRAIAVEPKSIDLFVGPDPNDANAAAPGDGEAPISIYDIYSNSNPNLSATTDYQSLAMYMREATVKFPTDWRPWLFLAEADDGLGKTAEEQAAGKQAAALMEPIVNRPGAGASSGRMDSLGSAYYLAGNFPKAKQVLQTTINAYPADPEPLNDLAYFIADSNDVSDLPLALTDVNQAIAKLQSMASIDDTGTTIALATFQDTLGWVQYRQHNYSQAVTTLQEAISNDPSIPKVRYHLGMAYLGLDSISPGHGDIDNHAAARAELASALAFDPNYAEPLQALAKIGPPSATASTDDQDQDLL